MERTPPRVDPRKQMKRYDFAEFLGASRVEVPPPIVLDVIFPSMTLEHHKETSNFRLNGLFLWLG